jgi:hypothetical protein
MLESCELWVVGSELWVVDWCSESLGLETRHFFRGAGKSFPTLISLGGSQLLEPNGPGCPRRWLFR